MQIQNKSIFTATNIIIAICLFLLIVAYLVLTFSSGVLNLPQVLVLLGAENLALVLSGEVWRIILSTFLHADIIHFALNMYGIYVVGKFIESYFGSRKLFTIFLISGAMGSVFSLTANFLISVISYDSFSVETISVGASGGLFGLLGMLLGNKIKGDIYSPELPIEERSLLLIIFINLFYGFFVPGINNWAHIGGLFTGIVFGLLFKPKLSFSQSKAENFGSNALFFISTCVLVVSLVLHIINIYINYL